MKLKLTIAILFAGLIVLSCKKEDKQPTTSPTGSGGGGSGSGYPVSNATSFSGIFTTGRYVGNYASITYDNNSASAYFASSPQPYMNQMAAVTVSNVAFNGDSLWYYQPSSYYISQSTSSTGVNLSSETWSVTGNNGIGSFSITNNFTTPSATGYASLPGVISLAAGFTCAINNVSNSSSSMMLISDGASGFCFKTLQSGNNTLTITPSDLSALATTTMGSIALILENKKAFVISGKDYKFTREFQYTKTLQIDP